MAMMRACMPYVQLMRLHQPTGIWLLLWPSWWSLAMAGKTEDAASPVLSVQLWLFLWFLLGAIIMRAAGCMINDLWDRRIDAQVARTAPQANGRCCVRAT